MKQYPELMLLVLHTKKESRRKPRKCDRTPRFLIVMSQQQGYTRHTFNQYPMSYFRPVVVLPVLFFCTICLCF